MDDKGRFVLVVALLALMATIYILNDQQSSQYGTPVTTTRALKKHHESSTKSSVLEYEHSSDIQHWCQGDDPSDRCLCQDPFLPVSGDDDRPDWFQMHTLNKHLAATAPSDLDMVLLGDSMTFRWREESSFSQLFSKSLGGEYEGRALGIDGDKSPHLLWRIQNGEIPTTLNPKIWWILVGTNDIGKLRNGRVFCSDEIIVPGILGVVKELRRQRPEATIVINGILPREQAHGHPGTLCLLKSEGSSSMKNAWLTIKSVNNLLEEYCEGDDKLHYFDASDLFIKENEEGRLYVPSEMLWDCLHPSDSGYKVLGEAIVEKMKTLLSS